MMMAANYLNKQNLENHWLTPTIWFCQLQSPGPDPPCPVFFGVGHAYT